MSAFTRLNAVNVNGHTETKNGLTYLSWAWAWAEIKKADPDASYTVYENKDGLFYHTDGRTCWVKTGVTVDGLEHIEFLPVMDYKNRSIPADQVTSFDVNKAIQRSLTKACARHGLGLYIYAGEDLPEDEAEKTGTKTNAQKAAEDEKKTAQVAAQTIGDVKVASLRKVCGSHIIPESVLAGRYGKNRLEEMTEADYRDFAQTGKAFLDGWDKDHPQAS